jgi:hypothetical protein
VPAHFPAELERQMSRWRWAEGDLPETADSAALASCSLAFTKAIAVQPGGGPSRHELCLVTKLAAADLMDRPLSLANDVERMLASLIPVRRRYAASASIGREFRKARFSVTEIA